jgi:hypothetical protein
MLAVIKNLFIAVYPLKLVFAFARDVENAGHVFLIFLFLKGTYN